MNMSYSSDNDDAEQCAKGEDLGKVESSFDLFIENNFGCSYGEMSCNARSNAMWQWKQHLKG